MIERKFNFEEGESALKTIREALGLSQQEFATLIGVSITSVSRWERGKTPATFTISQMRAFLKAVEPLGLDINTLPDDLAAYKSAGGD